MVEKATTMVSPVPDENLDLAERPVSVYDCTEDQIPDLSNFQDCHDDEYHDFYRETNEEPRRMMKHLHAALWATIGIAYMTNSP